MEMSSYTGLHPLTGMICDVDWKDYCLTTSFKVRVNAGSFSRWDFVLKSPKNGIQFTWVQEVRHPTKGWFSTCQLVPAVEMSHYGWVLIAVEHVHQNVRE